VEIDKYNSSISAKEAEVKNLESEISGSVKGAETVNEFIQMFFRHDGIKFEIAESKKFRLLRGGVPAKNLSEGEKTIISLAYFVARLEEKGNKLENTIVFVDDPVSSLDSNHLFNIYAFVKTKLENCQQLFISTHNMEFFNLLKDFLKDVGYGNVEKMPCYLVKRKWNSTVNQSSIEDLPRVLKRYRSEYAYLFGELKRFSVLNTTALDDHEYLFLMPNMARRFLEAYLGLRYPDGKSWGKKLDKLIKDPTKRAQIEKFVHEFSHSGSAIRTLKFPEALECKEIIDDILALLEEVDKDHYDALCLGTN
jgi:wobble nucleotide-excising tRNase